jgi:hypothetical protein
MKIVSFLLLIASVSSLSRESYPAGRSTWTFGGKRRTIENLITQLIRKLQDSQCKDTTEYEPKFM